MSLSQLPAFMAAMRKKESGGNYNALGRVLEGGSRGQGAYQILTHIWGPWAAEAGYAGADWRDPAVQDAVARFKMTQYYNRYGDWRLVALAWHGGPGYANRFKDRVLQDNYIPGSSYRYVRDLVQWMNEGSGAPGVGPAILDPGAEPGGPMEPRDAMRGMFDAMSNAVAGGTRSTIEEIIAARSTDVQTLPDPAADRPEYEDTTSGLESPVRSAPPGEKQEPI